MKLIRINLPWRRWTLTPHRKYLHFLQEPSMFLQCSRRTNATQTDTIHSFKGPGLIITRKVFQHRQNLLRLGSSSLDLETTAGKDIIDNDDDDDDDVIADAINVGWNKCVGNHLKVRGFVTAFLLPTVHMLKE